MPSIVPVGTYGKEHQTVFLAITYARALFR